MDAFKRVRQVRADLRKAFLHVGEVERRTAVAVSRAPSSTPPPAHRGVKGFSVRALKQQKIILLKNKMLLEQREERSKAEASA